MIVFTEHITSRLTYIADFILAQILGLEIKFTHDLKSIRPGTGPVINYSAQELANTLRIKPHGLLFQDKVKEQEIRVGDWEGMPVFFQSGETGNFPFDIFSASFYLISRYEEYLPHSRDSHGRFDHKESLAYKNGFLRIPLVDHWAMLLGNRLKSIWPGLEIRGRKYTHLSTIDVDIAWAFKHRTIVRLLGATARSIMKLDARDVMDRFLVLAGLKNDPYFTFPFIKEMHRKAGIRPVFFIQVGEYGKFDKNIPLHNTSFQRLLKELAKWADLGVHPSYASHDDGDALASEISCFKEITGQKKIKSRQHYLRFFFPGTYQNLYNLGVEEEYSMGYAGSTGFRAGTCTPFRFYDLSAEQAVSLQIVPFQVMDNTLKNYMGFTVEEAEEEIRFLKEQVKKVNGTFVSLWHNHSLSEYREWKGWRRMFERVFE